MRDESVCERCGGPNPDWLGPEFVHLVGSRTGIFCPSCFTTFDQDATWLVTRLSRGTQDQVQKLAEVLLGCLDDPSDAERLARCILDAGWRGLDEPNIWDAYRHAIAKCVARYKAMAKDMPDILAFLAEFEGDVPLVKLSRWLGYVQGVLIERGATTVQAERDWTRPLFRPLDFPD